jgi:hypothetical protein
MADTFPRKAPKHANPSKIKYLGVSSTHLDHRFPFNGADFRHIAGHTALAGSGLALNRTMRSRISQKSTLGTTTSAIWNTTYRECLTTLAPILISFSRSVLSDRFFTDLGNARRLKKLPKLYANANN